MMHKNINPVFHTVCMIHMIVISIVKLATKLGNL